MASDKANPKMAYLKNKLNFLFLRQKNLREKLGLERWVTGIADDERAKHSSNSCTGSGDSDSSSTSADKFGGGINIPVADGG